MSTFENESSCRPEIRNYLFIYKVEKQMGEDIIDTLFVA